MFFTADLLLISKASLGNACGAVCGAAAAFQKKSSFSLFITLIFFSFALCDGGYFFVAQSHYTDVPGWYVKRIASHSRNIFMSFLLKSLCNFLRVESIFRGLQQC